MSYDPYDAWLDQAREEYDAEIGERYLKEFGHELYSQHSELAIREFTAERLQSYYLKYPDMLTAATAMLEQASCLMRNSYPNAALLFATSAAEITIKQLLMKPILNGLVHNEAVADLVMGLTPPQTGSDTFKGLLFGVLVKVTEVDLSTYRRADSNRALWDEWKQLQKERNTLIHNGVNPSDESVAISIPVSGEFLNVLFPRVLAELGLEIRGKTIRLATRN